MISSNSIKLGERQSRNKRRLRKFKMELDNVVQQAFCVALATDVAHSNALQRLQTAKEKCVKFFVKG